MDPLQALMHLQADFEKIGEDREQFGWKFVPCPPDSTTFRFALEALDAEVYWFLCAWDGYPNQPPSLFCIDPATGDTKTPSAWPNCDGSRLDGFCWEISREGQTRLHPEWAQSPGIMWKGEGNPLLTVLRTIYLGILRNPKRYHGRKK